MIADVPLADIAPGHMVRDRVTLDPDLMAELKASIAAHGQRVPAEISPIGSETSEEDVIGGSPYRYGLISGWRRLRALTELLNETGDARYATIRAIIRPAQTAAESYVAMVEENEIRANLSYFERARVVAEATARGVFPDQSTALKTLFAAASHSKRSKIGSFIELYEAVGDLLNFPSKIPERLGLAVVSAMRVAGARALRARLEEECPPSMDAELALLEDFAKPNGAIKPKTASTDIVLRPGLTMRAGRRGSRISVTLSGTAVDDALLARIEAALKGV